MVPAPLTHAAHTAASVARHSATGARTVLGVAQHAARTVLGQARAGTHGITERSAERANELGDHARELIDDEARDIRTVTRTTTGQARAGAQQLHEEATNARSDITGRVTDALDDTPGSGTPYEQWTRKELYDRAQELDVPGRSTMDKTELIDALRSTRATSPQDPPGLLHVDAATR